MNFIVKIPVATGWKAIVRQRGAPVSKDEGNNAVLRVETSEEDQCRNISLNDRTFILVGDFIIPAKNRLNAGEYFRKFFSDFDITRLREAKGNFYLIIISEKEQIIQITGSMMSILPVYWYASVDHFFVSSRADTIVASSNAQFRINKKYIVEHLLFGYGFQSNTLFEKVCLVPANNSVMINAGTLSVSPHTELTDYFVSEPVSWKKSTDRLSDLFIERASDYLPEEPYFSSLTGGLDGRTILALGLGLGKQITAYSYGTADDKDVRIPVDICAQIKLAYKPFILDKEYAEQHFFNDAQQANRITEGNLRFSRATYLLMARDISKDSGYMVTGNFGSELMRTFHMQGNMMSHAVFDMIESVSDIKLAQSIRNSPRLRYLDLTSFKREIDELIDECLAWRNRFPGGLSPNQRLHRFIFEEVFRKYFGPEIILENDFLVNRTPFLDFKFFTEVLKSELAGCNSDYKTVNPFDRYKGQALYPEIIRKTYPQLLGYKLDREYSPGDFLSFFGKAKIAYGYMLRKLFIDRGRYSQPEYNRIAVEANRGRIDQGIYDFPFVDREQAGRLFSDNNGTKNYIEFNIFVSIFDYLKFILDSNGNVSV